MAPVSDRITGLILAGGRGARMGGADKGWIAYDGRPLIAHAVARFAPQVDELLISANRNFDRYRALGHVVVEDDIPGFAGPLAGVHAALRHAKFDLLACIPCDCPFLPTDLVARLRAALAAGGVPLAVARAGERLHPTCMLCRRELAGDLQRYLDSGGRRVRDWIGRQAHAIVDFEDAHAFANVNLPDQVQGTSRPA